MWFWIESKIRQLIRELGQGFPYSGAELCNVLLNAVAHIQSTAQGSCSSLSRYRPNWVTCPSLHWMLIVLHFTSLPLRSRLTTFACGLLLFCSLSHPSTSTSRHLSTVSSSSAKLPSAGIRLLLVHCYYATEEALRKGDGGFCGADYENKGGCWLESNPNQHPRQWLCKWGRTEEDESQLGALVMMIMTAIRHNDVEMSFIANVYIHRKCELCLLRQTWHTFTRLSVLWQLVSRYRSVEHQLMLYVDVSLCLFYANEWVA